MSTLQATANHFRAQLLRQERGAATEIVRAYGDAWQVIKADLDRLSATIQLARDAGHAVSPSWLFQQDRLHALLQQVAYQVGTVADVADKSTLNGQRAAVDAAQQHAQTLLQQALGPLPAGVGISFSRLSVGAFTDLVGHLPNGSPLRSLLDELGPAASESVQQALIQGLALGLNPREIATRVRQRAGMSLNRALTISRTETLRAYRTAALRTYQANGDVVKGWIWSASMSSRTCMACVMADGSWHPLDEQMETHPRCRCSELPQTRTWTELGIDTPRPPTPARQTGEEWFGQQPAERQLAMLGPGKYEAWQAGQVELQDLVSRAYSREWGWTRSEASLRQALANAAKRMARAAA
ncbi:MAG: phage minor head protein [Chloroflexota bacterium]